MGGGSVYLRSDAKTVYRMQRFLNPYRRNQVDTHQYSAKTLIHNGLFELDFIFHIHHSLFLVTSVFIISLFFVPSVFINSSFHHFLLPRFSSFHHFIIFSYLGFHHFIISSFLSPSVFQRSSFHHFEAPFNFSKSVLSSMFRFSEVILVLMFPATKLFL